MSCKDSLEEVKERPWEKEVVECRVPPLPPPFSLYAPPPPQPTHPEVCRMAPCGYVGFFFKAGRCGTKSRADHMMNG